MSTPHDVSRKGDGDATRVRLWKFRLGVINAGAVWGLAGILLFPADHPQYVMFLIFTLAGMTPGGVISFSADLISAVVFSVMISLPIAIRPVCCGDDFSMTMGVAVLLYLGFMIMSIRRINSNAYENISLRLEAASREEKVRESEERYRLLLSHLPVGIFHYDTNLVITYCNDRFAHILRNSLDHVCGVDMKLIKDQSILPCLRKALEGGSGHYEVTISPLTAMQKVGYTLPVRRSAMAAERSWAASRSFRTSPNTRRRRRR